MFAQPFKFNLNYEALSEVKDKRGTNKNAGQADHSRKRM